MANDGANDRETQSPNKRPVVLITGMSGAGLSTTLKAFEDLGYEAVDNLRLSLIPALVADDPSGEKRPLAVAVDSRNVYFSVDALLNVRQLLAEQPDLDAMLLFMECSDEALQRRFTETRRRHPLAIDRPVMDGIQRERDMLWKLRDSADQVIDTSLISIHELRRLVAGHFRLNAAPGLLLSVLSFSFRHGLPRESDLVLDVRFLDNPHYDLRLRPLTGQDPEIAAYIQKDPGYEPFLNHAMELLLPLLPRYQQEGKSYLTVAVGCTGGRHRSVLVAEELATLLAAQGYIVSIAHRDLDRGTSPEARRKRIQAV
ncbi:MAG: RNase adapter RapZ [Alphaproteobacteria bacterium]|nr:RNase adapter RapZ [Alphaproteobacteria bacterium]